MILCVGPTPAVQRVMIFARLKLDAVNRAQTTLDGAAGKAVNVAKVLKVLGDQPVVCGFLGGARGAYLREVLAEKGIESEFLTLPPNTRECITVLDESAGTQTELVEESQPVPAAAYDDLKEIVRRRAIGCRAVVLSGTITPGGPTDLYYDCVRMARQGGALSVVDAQGSALLEALKAGPTLIKPNRQELAATVGRELNDEAAVQNAMRDLCGRGAERIVVTSGKQPALAFDGATFSRITGPAIRAVNPIGSGDAFTAGLVSRLLHGDSLGEACRWASAAGAANALTPMPGELNREDVERLAAEVRIEPIAP